MKHLRMWLIAKVLGYIDQSRFESLYSLIRETEQTLNGYMAYVQRQQAGSKEYGDKAIRYDIAEYTLSDEDESSMGHESK